MLTREVPAGTTVGQVLEQLISEHPSLAGAEAAVSFSVNRVYASADTVLNAGDEVAFIPPVSGGGSLVYIGNLCKHSFGSKESSLSLGRGPG